MDQASEGLLDRVVHNLSYHKPRSQMTQDAMEDIRSAARDFADIICNTVPYSRELSLTVGHIEDACMNAIAGLARNEDKFLANLEH